MSGLAANAAAARDFITATFGITNIGGWRSTGSVPGSDHPLGKALDVMIANYLSEQGIALGTRVADWFIQNPNAFGTKYVIWRDRINQDGSWSPYSHPGGNNDTLAHRDHVHLSFLTGDGTFVGQPVGDNARAPWLANILGSLGVNMLGGFGVPAPVAGGLWAPNVERWRSTVLQALGLTGQSASAADIVLRQISSESSGDPRAINLYDSNAIAGHPSRGLVQTIPSTFAAYRLASLPNDIYNPLANIVAGIRYAVDRYGSLGAGMRGVAYDTGGWLEPMGQGVNMLNRPEAVLTPAQSRAFVRDVENHANGGGLVINLDNSDPLQVAVAAMIRGGIEAEQAQMLTVGRRQRGQHG